MRPTLLILFLLTGLLTSCGEDENTTVCSTPSLISAAEISDTSALIQWLTSEASSYLVSYKISESLPIENTELMASVTTILLTDLEPSTNYELRVQAICDDATSEFSEVFFFATEPLNCPAPNASSFDVLDYNEVFLDWNETGTEISWEVEYGPTGFSIGSGIIKPASVSELLLDALIVGTTYDYYIRSICENSESAYSNVNSFTTEACEIPTNVEVFNVSSNSVTFNWNPEGQEVWEFEYGFENFELGDGTVLFTETIPATIDGLAAATRYEFYVRANCGPNGRSEYVGPILIETLP